MVSIHVTHDSLTQSKDGAISGIIYCDFGKFHFPERNWNDQVIAVLNGWLSQLQTMDMTAPSEARLLFMEGPFVIIVSRDTDSPLCKVDCICKSDPEKPEWTGICDLKDLKLSVCLTARSVLKVCTSNGWKNSDTSAMAALLETLSTSQSKTY